MPVSDRSSSRRLHAVIFAALGFLLLELIEVAFRPSALGGMYFQRWNSERMQQALPLLDLRAAPLQSLWHLHMQPPLYDTVRALLVARHPDAEGLELVRRVDADLYHVWALAYGALGGLVFHWLRAIGVRPAGAAVLAGLLLLHPATIGFATLLEGTLLSTLVTTWVMYELWRFQRQEGSPVRLAGAGLAAYLTRSLFQWPFFGLLLACLALLAVPRRKLVQFGSIVAVVVGLYSAKQLWLFGTTSTSTLVGTNLSRSIGADCEPTLPDPRSLPSTPGVLHRASKLSGNLNYNHQSRLAAEQRNRQCYFAELARRPLSSLPEEYWKNLKIFLAPSSSYTPNVIVDRLPWRKLADTLSSNWVFVCSLVGAAALYLFRARRAGLRTALALSLPVAYVCGLSIFAERGENMRFRFFLEPTFFVFLVAEFREGAKHVVSWLRRH